MEFKLAGFESWRSENFGVPENLGVFAAARLGMLKKRGSFKNTARRCWAWLFLFCLFCSAPAAFAATEVAGVLTEDTTWTQAQAPYLVTADINISNGALLTIEPGVTVLMNPEANLIVSQGALRALGNAEQAIVLTSARDTGTPNELNAAPGDWGQLVFLAGTRSADTRLDSVEIRYGKGIRIESASPQLDRLRIHNNAGAAISVDLHSSPSGSGLQATGNTLNGVSVPAGEIEGIVRWGLLGLPYVIEEGELSVGKRVTITGITPETLQPGQSVDAVLSGTRLTGLERVDFDRQGLSAVISPGGSATEAPLRITADENAALGTVKFTIQADAGQAHFARGIEIISLKQTLVVNDLTPDSLRRGASANFQISGNYLEGAQIAVPPGSGLSLSQLQTTMTQASFTLAASSNASLGAQRLSVSNAALANGSAEVALTIAPALPKLAVRPSPLTVPPAISPTGDAHSFSIELSASDTLAHTVHLALGDPSIASVSPAQITLPAGSTAVSANLTGLKLGYTTLTLSSPTLASLRVGIYVANSLIGETVGPVVSPLVGVTRPSDEPVLTPGLILGPVVSPLVGVTRPSDEPVLTPGLVLGPVVSPLVGVTRPSDEPVLTPGLVLGPVVSPLVGVTRPSDEPVLTPGLILGPVLSPAIEVDWLD